jgi:hypothetical protein
MLNKFKTYPDHIKYGIAVFVAVFFVGLTTGMGGSLLPNIGFSVLMGIMAAYLFRALKKYSGRKD